MNQEQYEDILSRLETLESEAAARREQQIRYPLDEASRNIINGI